MVLKLVDTTFLIDVVRGRKDAKKLLASSATFVTTQINMYEVLVGIFSQREPGSGAVVAHSLLSGIPVLPCDDAAIIKAADLTATLQQVGKEIGHMDSLIAGAALSKGVTTIVTKNVKHFKRIKGLKVETY
ncbi:hypothetical protein CL620_03550 [archaeon]|jgi:predicted nucleic acid-binding protein|nr:hypothetical protein [archaeon]|tara:strand:- start:420 stop:812 length:393 start_codon:yes stop_codon:yes gene_type:complete